MVVWDSLLPLPHRGEGALGVRMEDRNLACQLGPTGSWHLLGLGAPDVCHPEVGTGLVWGRNCEVWGTHYSCNDEACLEILCDMTFTLQSLSVSSLDHEENEAWASPSPYTLPPPYTHTLAKKALFEKALIMLMGSGGGGEGVVSC